MNSQSNQTIEVINEANLSVSFISKVKFEDDNFFFWKAKPSNIVFYAPIEPYSKYRLGIKFENTGNYLKDYSFMGNQIKLYGNPQLLPGPDDGNRGGSIVSMFNGTDEYAAISENLNFNMEWIKETETGFSLWYRLKQLSMAPSVIDETPKVLIFHTDADDLRYSYCASVDVNGNVFWYVYDNGVLCQTFAKAFFPIWNEADFDIRNFLSPDFATTIQTTEDTTTVPYNDLVFDYKFSNRMCRIFKNGYAVSGNEYSLQLDGVDDTITLTNNAALNNLDSFTISFWWYPTNFGPSSTPWLVHDGYSTNNSFLIYVANVATGAISFRIVNSAAGQFTATTTANPLNTWYHVICKFNRVTGAMTVRINDVQRATATATAVTPNVIGGAANILINAAAGVIKWAGKMDEFKLWRSELSDADCSKVYNEGGLTPDYFLPMNTGSGTVLTDQISGTYTATLAGGIVWVKPNHTGVTIPTPPFPAVLSVNTRLHINTTASAEEVGFEATKASDRLLATLWKKISGFGSWIKAEVGELGEPQPITLIKIAWYLGNVRRYTFVVEVSKDNLIWQQVYSGQSSGTTEALETYDFPNILALFVRVTVNGNTVNNEAGIYEIEVYGGKNLAQPEIPEEIAAFVPFYTVNNIGTDYMYLKDGVDDFNSPFYTVPATTPNWRSLNTNIFKRGEWAANSGSDLIGKTPTKISLWIRKIGSPTGTATVCIRKKSNQAMRKVFGTINVATITSSGAGAEYFFTNIGTRYAIQLDDIVLLEYLEATAGNNIEVAFSAANVYDVDSYKSYLSGGTWVNDTTQDICGTMSSGGTVGANLNKRLCIFAHAPDSRMVRKLITKVTFYLKKIGSPTGTLFFRLRYYADDTIKTEFGTMAASALTTDLESYTFTKTDANYQFQYLDSLCIEYVPPAGINSTHDQVAVKIRTPSAIDGDKTCLRAHSGTNYGSADTSKDIVAILYQGGQLLSEFSEAIAQPPVYSKDLFLNASIKGTDLSLPGNIVGFNNCIACEFHLYWINPTPQQVLNYFLNRLSISNLALGTVAQCGYAVFTS